MENKVIYLDDYIYKKLRHMRKFVFLTYILASSYTPDLDFKFYEWLKANKVNLDVACKVIYGKQKIAKKELYFFKFKLPGSDTTYTLINNSPLKPSVVPISEVLEKKDTLFTEAEILQHNLPKNAAFLKEY